MAVGANQRTTGGGLRIDEDGRLVTTSPAGIADTAMGYGSVAAPVANTSIATITTRTGGEVYDIEATVILSGTAEAAPLNLQLRIGAVQIAVIPTPAPNVILTWRLARYTMPTNATLNVASIASATAGSVYTSSLRATRIA